MCSGHGHATITSAGSLVHDVIAQPYQFFKKTGDAYMACPHGPLIKSPAEEQPQDTQQNESAAKGEDS